MNRAQLRSELAFLLNVSEGEADQDFVTTRLNKLLDRAYNLEVERAKLAGTKAYFQAVSAEFEWTASSQTLTVPTELLGVSIIEVRDLSSTEPGVPVTFGEKPDRGGDCFWKDRSTWQWANVGGPPSALTLRATYEEKASDLQDDEDEPALIPSQFHWIIVWSAAVLGRVAADDRVPPDYREELNEMRLDFYKHVSKGRPLSMPPRIQNDVFDGTGILF